MRKSNGFHPEYPRCHLYVVMGTHPSTSLCSSVDNQCKPEVAILFGHQYNWARPRTNRRLNNPRSSISSTISDTLGTVDKRQSAYRLLNRKNCHSHTWGHSGPGRTHRISNTLASFFVGRVRLTT